MTSMTKEAIAVREASGLAAQDRVMQMMQAVIEKGGSVDNLQKFVDLLTQLRREDARQQFAHAMSAFQADLPPIQRRREVKDRNGRLLYKFANEDDIADAIKPIERAHGFSHRFEFPPCAEGLAATCIVTHVSGHSESTTATVPPTTGMNTNASQNRGIEIAYARRMALAGAYGITSSDDNDARTDAPEPASAESIATLRETLKREGRSEADCCGYLGVEKLEQASAEQIAEAMRIAQKPRGKKISDPSLEKLM